MSLEQKVVVTGIGLVTPLGFSIREVWNRCLSGESGIRFLERFDTSGHRCRVAATVPDFDITSFLRIPKNQKFMNSGVRCAVRAAKEAVAAGNLDLAGFDPERIALHVASGCAGPEPAEFFPALALATDGDRPSYAKLGGRPSRLIDPYFPLRTLSNSGVGLLSAEIGAQGASSNFVQTDTASALAIGAAFDDLREMRCDLALAVGYESLVTISNYLAYEREGLLSGLPPEEAHRPFDRARDGIVLGEGAGAIVLERLEDARRRNAPIWGEVVGLGAAVDISDSLQPLDAHRVAGAALSQAVADGQVGFVIANGIATREGDRTEAGLLSSLFDRGTPVTAFKGCTGYLGAATATVELCLGLLSIQNGTIPPIAHCSNPDPEFSPDLVVHSARLMDKRDSTAVLMNWSWGGQCTVLAVRAVPDSA